MLVMWVWIPMDRPETLSGCLELELQAVVSSWMCEGLVSELGFSEEQGAEKLTYVLWKSSICS